MRTIFLVTFAAFAYVLACSGSRGDVPKADTEHATDILKIQFHVNAVSDRNPLLILNGVAACTPFDTGIVVIHRGQTTDDPPLLDKPVDIPEGDYKLQDLLELLNTKIPNLSWHVNHERITLQVGDGKDLENPIDSKLPKATQIRGSLSDGMQQLSQELPKVPFGYSGSTFCDRKHIEIRLDSGISMAEAVASMAMQANARWIAHVYENPPDEQWGPKGGKPHRTFPGYRIKLYCETKDTAVSNSRIGS